MCQILNFYDWKIWLGLFCKIFQETFRKIYAGLYTWGKFHLELDIGGNKSSLTHASVHQWTWNPISISFQGTHWRNSKQQRRCQYIFAFAIVRRPRIRAEGCSLCAFIKIRSDKTLGSRREKKCLRLMSASCVCERGYKYIWIKMSRERTRLAPKTSGRLYPFRSAAGPSRPESRSLDSIHAAFPNWKEHVAMLIRCCGDLGSLALWKEIGELDGVICPIAQSKCKSTDFLSGLARKWNAELGNKHIWSWLHISIGWNLSNA